ncbi:antitoxin VbhA family protein [Corynebacterium lizhenjunii]|uniref:Antitoxin VbhA family protein n=1 Tax=Corynebacterium lizhenjunii TaxID=2709394 RepID=A0A7T0KFJ4_9CORY|nr:antitoxin VbhA family protein [Corynebacterium lizhenjunii]QPK79421.1 antitoxin VbhA family protein [Corynebacterium lizhenjunii]
MANLVGVKSAEQIDQMVATCNAVMLMAGFDAPEPEIQALGRKIAEGTMTAEEAIAIACRPKPEG